MRAMLGNLATTEPPEIAMQAQAKNFELLTIGETVQRLRVGREKVSALINAGQLKAIRLGSRCIRVKADSVERLING